ncbi:MAG: phosphoribosyl-ATP diphosphatase [Actinobacteria bacterium]|nr:phosphoribosyl-ATP diphosphatase [Actinomycetota bacterium]
MAPTTSAPDPDGAAGGVLEELERVLAHRRRDPPPGSYSVTLMADPELAQRKIMEESFELCLELGRATADGDRVAEEAADVVFHVLAALVGAGVPLEAVLARLRERRR